MKKRLLVFLALVLTFAVAIGISACSPEEAHTHDWSTEWAGDETNHWHNCNGCDQHTGTAAHEYDDDNDADCNVCGKVRHIHTYKWEHDNEYHWQVKECHPDDEVKDRALHDFSNGLQCPVCGFDSTGVHQHTYEWRYNETQHWEESVCAEEHEVVTRELGNHEFDPDTGLCKCGTSEAETQVYALYKSNEEYKGAQAKAFADWKKEWTDAGVHHVALTQTGDGALYTAKSDAAGEYDEEVKYFAQRTVSLRAFFQEGTLETNVEDVCFVIKCKVDDEFAELNSKKVIAAAKTDAEGAATLTFTPVFGYTSAKVKYVVALASTDELMSGMIRPIPYGYKILDSEAEKALEVNGSSVALSVNFGNIHRMLGEGDRGQLDNVRLESYNEGAANTSFYLDSLTEGFYKVELKATEKGYMSDESVFVSVNGGGSQDMPIKVITRGDPDEGGGEGWFYVYITEDSQLLSLRRTIGQVIGNIKLTKITDFVINQTEHAYELVGSVYGDPHFANVEYDISGLARGMYIYTATPADSIRINGQEFFANNVFEIKEGDTKLTVDAYGKEVVIRNFILKPVKEITADNEETIPFDADNKSFVYYFNSDEKGSYSITLSSENGGFKDLSVKYRHNRDTYYPMTSESAESKKLYFSADAGQQYLFTFSTTNDECPAVKATFHFEKAQEVNLDEEFEITFSSESTQKDYTMSVPRGAYIVKVTGENLSNVSVKRDNSSLISSGNDGATILTEVFAETGDLKESTFHFIYSGSDNYPTISVIIETLAVGEATAVTANTDFTVTLSAEAQYTIFSYKPTDKKAEYYSLLLSSEADISKVKVYTFTVSGSNIYSNASSLMSTSSGPDDKERSQQCSSSLSSTFTLYMVFVYDKTADYPSAITANFHYRFNLSNSSYAPRSLGNYQVGFDKVDGADSYELYMSSKQYSGFKKVADFDSDDELVYTYTETAGGNMYFYFIAKDSTGKYLEGQSATNREGIGFAARKKIDITLTVPEGFDNDVTFIFKSTMSGSSMEYGREKRHIKAEPGNLTVTLSMLLESYDSSCKVSLTIDGANKNIYKVPAAVTASSSPLSASFIIEKNPIITVTVNFNEIENFAGGNITATIYSVATAGSSFGSGSVNVEQGAKSATIEVPVTSSSAFTELYAALTTVPNGYAKEDVERVKVNYSEDTKTGTVTLGLIKLPEVTVSLNFPANVENGSYTVKLFAKTGDDVASSASATLTIKAVNTAEASTVSDKTYLPKGTYVAKVTVPSNSGYSADDAEFTVSGMEETVSITVKDRITITVTVEANKNPSPDFVYVNVYEQGKDDAVVASGYVFSFKSETEIYKGTKEIYVPSGKSYVVKGDTTKTAEHITFTKDSDNVVVEGTNGTATLKVNVASIYTINVNVYTGSASSGTSGTLVLYKNGEEFKTQSMSLSASATTKTITLLEEEYDPNAQYAVRFKTASNYYFCPGKIVNFGSQNKADVYATMTKYDLGTTGKVYFNVPADFEDSTNSYKITLYEIGGVKICDLSNEVTFSPGNSSQQIITYNLADSDTMYWEFTTTGGNGIISTMDSSKKWEASVPSFGSSKTVNVTIQRRAEASLTVTAPTEFAQNGDNTVTVIVLNSAKEILLKQKITVTSGTTQATATLYLPEASGCKILYEVGEGYTVSGNDTYTADTSGHTVDSIAVTVSKNG